MARFLLVVPMLGAPAVAAAALHRPLYRTLTTEDGVFEWLQFAFGGVAAALGVAVVVSLWREGLRRQANVWAIFALGCFFVTGEEIAWGQRILELETPPDLAAINHQNEITVHNIKSIPLQSIFNACFAIVGLYGSVIALWLRARFDASNHTMNLFVPPAALFSLFFLGFLYRAIRLLLFPEPRFLIVKYGEYTELCLMGGLAAFAFLVLQRRRRETIAAPKIPQSSHRGDESLVNSPG